MGAASTELLLYTKIRWLSKGKVLKHVYDLHEELKEFFYHEGAMEFKDKFCQNEKLNQIMYLTHTFGLLNDLKVSLQGLNSFITDFHDKSFQLNLWI
jgi:hypothetical protein